MRPSLISIALIALLTAPVVADPPQINNITPYGVQRSVPTEITINGANLGTNPQLVSPVPVAVEPPAMPGDASNWKLKLTVPPEVPLGIYTVRVKTDDGISNPFLLAVGQFPNVAEAEPNSHFEQAQVVPFPAVVEGQSAGNDVDYYKFTGRKGQRVVVDALCSRIGSGIDPQIRLTTAGRKFVASEDDSPGLMTDARLAAELPEDGEYIVEISDSKYQGGGRAVYRLLIADVPAPIEVYPLGGRRGETVGFELRGGTIPGPDPRVAATQIKAAAPAEEFRPRFTNHALDLAGPSDPTYEADLTGPLDVSDYPELREPSDPNAPPLRAAAPVVLNGRIDPAGDVDRFNLAVAAGQKLRIHVHASDLGSALDGVLRVLNPADNKQLANADDTQPTPTRGKGQNRRAPGLISPDPSLEYTVGSGLNEVTLELRDLASRGGLGYPYRITVEPADPTYAIEMAEAQVNVPKGGTIAVPVSIGRQGYNGPITLSVTNPPLGLTVRAGQVADGQPVGVLTLSAAADASVGPVVLDVIGTGQGASGPIVEKASKQVVFAQQANFPVNLQTQTGLPAATTSPTPVILDAPEGPIEAVHGYPATIPVKLTRTEGADAGVSITPLPLPPGLAIPEAKVADKANEGNVTVNIDPGTALGKVTVGLVAKGKFDKKDQTFAVPAVTLDVVRPATLELAAPNLEVKAGQTVELKGKVMRRGPFKEAVKVQLNGLPGGLKAEPVDVAADAFEFTIKIVADAGAGESQANTQVAMAFKVGGKDYNIPPTPLALKVVK